MGSSILLTNGIIFENSIPKNVNIEIRGKYIQSITYTSGNTNGNVTADSNIIDLKGKKIYPGFINSHDHLLASYLPKVGGGEKYSSWLAFDNLYKSSGLFAERQQLESELLYYLGAYKNLFAGVTSVHDHIPHFVQEPFLNILPIKLISEYFLSHAIGNYSLHWGEGAALEYKLAEASNKPYVTHLGEGTDEDSLSSLKKLEKAEALGPCSVLIHCLPFGPKEVDKIARANASVVWCPSSNLHIFGKTTNIKLFLDAGVNVCLGTDFSPSGSVNLLEEIKLAKSLYRDLYEEELRDSIILDWITKNPSKAFRNEKIGNIREGCSADFVIFDDTDNNDEISVSNRSSSQIDLMIVDGQPILASSNYKKLFSDLRVLYESIQVQGREKIIAGSPISLLNEVSASVGYKKELAYLPIF